MSISSQASQLVYDMEKYRGYLQQWQGKLANNIRDTKATEKKLVELRNEKPSIHEKIADIESVLKSLFERYTQSGPWLKISAVDPEPKPEPVNEAAQNTGRVPV
jgi:hypothetical protein